MAFTPASVGIILFLTGLVFFLLVWGFLRLIPRWRPRQAAEVRPQAALALPAHDHAALVVRSGGRVEYINLAGREWFNLREGEQPNLETLVRRIRPGEEFLKLCAAEGRARFSVNGRPVEGFSYQVPGPEPATLISFSRPELLASGVSEPGQASRSALKILTDFSEATSRARGLSTTVIAILDQVERLIPADRLEVKLCDPEGQLLTLYRLGVKPGLERNLEKEPPAPAQGHSAFLVSKRQPLFLADTQDDPAAAPPVNPEAGSVRSYIGLPLVAGGEQLVGTLEAGLTSAETYTQQDLEVMQLIAGQAAIAIRNASMLEEEQRRAAELSGLADLSQALGSARNYATCLPA